MPYVNPYKIIIGGGSIHEALAAAAKLTTEELDAQAQSLSVEEFRKLSALTEYSLKASHVRSTLYLGGMLELYHAATTKDDRGEHYAKLVEAVGVSSTKAYDSRAVFRAFAEKLLEHSALIPRFSVESLKRLSAKDAPPEAREAAIEIAAKGEQVTTPRAVELLEEHGYYGDPAGEKQVENRSLAVAMLQPSSRRLPKRVAKRRLCQSRDIWKYSHDGARLVIKSGDTQTPPSQFAIKVLEAALEQCRREIDETAIDSGESEGEEDLSDV